ncbi:cytochrome c-type biogenesis protein CcmH [Acidicapsa dinghuensis]|uniref:Cytochrome c-type biogenesis protein n=1 Tax=Acidicapsa dinghuensis TaxID=2218256 RepID=A0ABW1ELY0_9BACT|nr:cytochrome c-type biogenesis protein CcmH [Acidicapsa dinghuensis]
MLTSHRNSWFSRFARPMQAIAVAVLVCLSLAATDTGDRFHKLGDKLMCTCGCAQMLLGCDHYGCPSRGEEMDRLRTGIASGQDDATILQGFVQEYGMVVLSAPPTKGFNLVAWIMPFAVSILALGGTALLVRNWIRQQPKLVSADSSVSATPSPTVDSDMRERIRRETNTEGEV